MRRGAQKVKAAYKENEAAARRLQREARKIYESTRTPQEQHAARLRQAKILLDKNKISADTYARAVKKSEMQLHEANRATKQTGQSGIAAFGGAIASVQTLAGAAGIGMVLAGLNRVHAAYEVWLQDSREVSAATQKAVTDFVAFNALQEKGTKRDRMLATAALGAAYGVYDTSAVAQAGQAMQSLPGSDYETGRKRLEMLLQMSRLNVKLEDAQELETFGAASKMGVGELPRMAFVAGEASARDPAALSKAGPGMKYWQEKEFGISAAGVLAANLPARAIADLSKTRRSRINADGERLKRRSKRRGLGEAGQQERLKWLKQQGLDTVEELRQFGFTEIRGTEAVAGLVQNLEAVYDIQEKVKKNAKPGLFQEKWNDIIAEVPEQEEAFRVAVSKARYQHETAFGQQSMGAMKLEREQVNMGTAAREQGTGTAFGIDVIDEEGRMSAPKGWAAAGWQALKEMSPWDYLLGPQNAAKKLGERTVAGHMKMKQRAAQIDLENQSASAPPLRPAELAQSVCVDGAGDSSGVADDSNTETPAGAVRRLATEHGGVAGRCVRPRPCDDGGGRR